MAKLDANELYRAHKELKTAARQRIAERGILQFRADAETVKAVLLEADKLKIPVGAMLRQWVQEKLTLKTNQQKSPDLVQRVLKLEKAITDLRRKLAR